MCPNCGCTKTKSWDELDSDELILVDKLPLNTEYSPEERKTHLFCRRCCYEFVLKNENGKEKLA